MSRKSADTAKKNRMHKKFICHFEKDIRFHPCVLSFKFQSMRTVVVFMLQQNLVVGSSFVPVECETLEVWHPSRIWKKKGIKQSGRCFCFDRVYVYYKFRKKKNSWMVLKNTTVSSRLFIFHIFFSRKKIPIRWMPKKFRSCLKICLWIK